MDWTRFFFIVVGAGTASTLTDWVFAGDWMHKRFTYPEIWREKQGGKGAFLAALLPFLTCAAFFYMAVRLDIASTHNALKLAAAVWVIGPLPLILTGAAYIKLHWAFVIAYAFSWLVKLTIIAVLVGRFPA